MRLTVLDCGAMTADLTFLLLKRGRTLKLRHQRGIDDGTEWYRVSTHCVLVEAEDGTRLLWDTSCPRDWESRWEPVGTTETFPYDDVREDQYLDSQLAALGLCPDDIDIVVLSHLHLDHAGNARLFEGTKARFVCSKAELEYGLSFEGSFEGAYIKADYEGLPWETIDEDLEILPGVTLLQVPGHSAGCLAMLVDLPESGPMIFTSDSVNMTDSFGPPPVPAVRTHDMPGWISAVERIRSIADQRKAVVVFGHDSAQLAGMKVAPEFYA